jgi:prenyltransferase beta subunit
VHLKQAITVVVAVAALLAPGCIKDPLGPQIQDRAVAYLVGSQNADGGWAAAPDGPSDFGTTCWVVLALSAADADAGVLERAKARLAAWSDNVSRDDTGSFSASNAVALYVLAGLALGVPDAAWNGTHPLDRLEAYTSNQTLALNEKLFIVGALGRAGHAAPAAALRDEIRSKLDGGNQTELGSDGWFRSTGVLAMLASGDDAESESSRMWARSLLPFQKEEGGFFSDPKYEPDASTTASVLAVLNKIRFVYSEDRTSATEFLGEMQQDDGWVRFSKEYDFGRAKTTAEAVLGLSGAGVFGA